MIAGGCEAAGRTTWLAVYSGTVQMLVARTRSERSRRDLHPIQFDTLVTILGYAQAKSGQQMPVAKLAGDSKFATERAGTSEEIVVS